MEEPIQCQSAITYGPFLLLRPRPSSPLSPPNKHYNSAVTVYLAGLRATGGGRWEEGGFRRQDPQVAGRATIIRTPSPPYPCPTLSLPKRHPSLMKATLLPFKRRGELQGCSLPRLGWAATLGTLCTCVAPGSPAKHAAASLSLPSVISVSVLYSPPLSLLPLSLSYFALALWSC